MAKLRAIDKAVANTTTVSRGVERVQKVSKLTPRVAPAPPAPESLRVPAAAPTSPSILRKPVVIPPQKVKPIAVPKPKLTRPIPKASTYQHEEIMELLKQKIAEKKAASEGSLEENLE